MKAIVNCTKNWGIGCENNLLVNIPEDLKRFRLLTQGGTVVMGHATLRSLPGSRPLKNRRNIVFSRDPDLKIEGAEVVSSAQELFSLVSPEDENVFLIGGEAIYRLLLPWCSHVLVTRVDALPQADRFFPDLDASEQWEIEQSSEEFDFEGIKYRYVDYKRVFPSV